MRGGSLDAYGALYERHASAARILARQYVRSQADADDVVADAFQRVLGVLRQGSGPDTHFRAYLFTVVRRLAADLAAGAHRTRPTADDGTFELALGPSGSSEDPALAGFESSVVARAYERLPERWQAVLWYTEVERLSPADVAPILGLTPNGVSALAYRAREGLRVGYLQEHLTAVPADSCRVVNPMLGGYVRGSLSQREVAKVDGHLGGCDDCRMLVLELGDVAHGMRVVIAPLVLGVAGLALMGALPLGAVTGAGLAGVAAAGAGGTGAGVAGAGASVGSGVASGGAGLATGSAATAGAGAGAAGTGAAGAAGAAGAGAGAGAGAAGAGVAGAAGSAAASGTAAATAATTAATAATASTATSVATTAVVATGTAGMSAVTVAASTGAVAAATVGVVSVLGAMSGGEPAPLPELPPVAVASPWPSPEAEELPEVVASPAPEPSADPTNPVNVPPLVDADAVDHVVVPPPADVTVALVDPGDVIEPRVTDHVALQVGNAGGSTATDAQLRVTLPAGMALGVSSSPAGASTGPQVPIDTTSLPCTATVEPQVVQCRVGTLDPGETRTVTVPVVASSGGTYGLGASVWADGLEERTTALPETQVAYFGPELTADAGQVAAVDNPGRADVTFTVRNSGDLTAAAGWVTRVKVPASLAPHSVAGGLTCEGAGDAADGYRSWRCTGPELDAGASLAGVATVVADGATSAGYYTLQVVPELPGDGPVVRDAATFPVARAWAGAVAGAGAMEASCRAGGGIGVADAVVTGKYTNLTSRTLTVALDAAGSSSASSRTLAPGESANLVVPDGLRVPAGTGTWRLSTTVAGGTYSRTVDTSGFGDAECYDPPWNVDPTARVVNDGGTVRIEGTLVNRDDDPMQVTMNAAGTSSGATQLGAGETLTLSVATDKRSVDAGSVTFDVVRWRTDRDGDQPTRGVRPASTPTAAYRAATIAPAAGDAQGADECAYDPASETSTRTFTVLLDNSASTLPVDFEVRVGDRTERVRLADGVTKTVRLSVPWGTASGRVLADGREIRTLDVSFASCATPLTWPDDVTVTAAAQCEAGSVLVVVDVANGGVRAWDASVERRGATAASGKLAASGAQRFVIDTDRWYARGGEVTVRLARTVEGSEQVVSRTATHRGARCPVVAPAARLADVETRLDRYGDWATSWREPQVVLDNSGSNIPVTFTVTGPAGFERAVKVAAGGSETVAAPRVDGRHGATYTVTTRRWSTTLDTGTFTAAEAGWCAEGIAWGMQYTAGDVRSWKGVAYRYAGWDGSAPEGAPTDGPGAAWWKDGSRWNGQWRQWEKIGLCEYR
ncbi:RNA polymerase sigma factor SigV [Isoptericola dokdonensis DS-3]|uniref:RNA polymerase sigma factor SigV n=1 Tax=Isoptericola dokdonensis DS-3 TaxID=1300344 RepID=A0A161I931_9MICO|nr:RNA polymerase sigma factor SigV [Isoptericola dokdonensis DS-3]